MGRSYLIVGRSEVQAVYPKADRKNYELSTLFGCHLAMQPC